VRNNERDFPLERMLYQTYDPLLLTIKNPLNPTPKCFLHCLIPGFVRSFLDQISGSILTDASVPRCEGRILRLPQACYSNNRYKSGRITRQDLSSLAGVEEERNTSPIAGRLHQCARQEPGPMRSDAASSHRLKTRASTSRRRACASRWPSPGVVASPSSGPG